jgi:hypothetical protein
MKWLWLGTGLAFATVLSAHADQTFSSGPGRVTLVELFTSEGCSSCPPAERWLAALKSAPGLWASFVPVAFHVNYWDHLGWRDRLADERYTDREHAYAAEWAAPSVYTPCFVRNGREWRPRGEAARELSGANEKSGGELAVTWRDDQTCTIRFVPAASGKPGRTRYDVNVALLGSGIESNVRAGENRGRKLQHEFVALRLERAELSPAPDGGFVATLQIPSRPDLPAPRHALAAWVTERSGLAVLQATGGWLEPEAADRMKPETRKP